jgi:hypothetical protein
MALKRRFTATISDGPVSGSGDGAPARPRSSTAALSWRSGGAR